ncbi:AMP-binding protein [Pseudoalteromonas phenolica]|uniref:AMP-dependent synthetase n=1 Tax=Pseudoalteromonas phenolica TaxID=161398 RepID=A0A0S2K050_9GAMM|nr:AMP-binding protein [Pseudoalteromonas phenolica]ALO41442.1 AMP-dependent synthetase [Pseudoalteromonas phenolica]MBE0354012.1 hypothetical protein [Pseudoalteromonas phenolica O-BC30]
MKHSLDFINLNRPNATAIISQDGQHITYQQLAHDTVEASRLLEPNNTIFIIAKNDYPAVTFYLAGMEFNTVPLLLSNRLQAEQLQSLIMQYQPNFILVDKKRVNEFTGFNIVHERKQYCLLKKNAATKPKLHPKLAFLATTSGSTGSPKLVRFSKQNLISNARSIIEYLAISEKERAIAHLPISYSYGLSILNSHLIAGASIYLTNETIMDKSFWESMAEHDITSFSGVPFHYESLLRMRLSTMNLPKLKTMTQAGGKLNERFLQKMSQLCEQMNVQFWVMYGQTEASPRIAYLPSNKLKENPDSIGVAIPHGKLWVKDREGRDITSSGKIGELVYEGDNVCLGYAKSLTDLNNGDENKGLLETGDLALCHSGLFFLKGRIKRFIKVFGNRISLTHVETILYELGYDAIAYGSDDKLNIAIVGNLDIDLSKLKFNLSELLAINFTAINIKTISRIPRLESGKVDYQCLMK